MCLNNPCGCASTIELPYLTGNTGASGTNGTNGVGIDSITPTVDGDNVTLTVTYTNATTEEVTFIMPTKAYVLESNIVNPYIVQKTATFLGDIAESLLIVPEGELPSNGDVVQLSYVFNSSGAASDQVIQLQINDTTICAPRFSNGKHEFIAEVSRVSDTSLYYVVYFHEAIVGGPDLISKSELHSGFISVSDIDLNAFTFELEIPSGLGTGTLLNLIKAQTKVIKI